MKYIFIFLMALLLTGCWDDINLENRAFVVSIGIDQHEDGYKVTLGIPDVAQISQPDGEDTKYIKSGTGATVLAAMKDIERSFSQKPDYTHARVSIINEDILKDDKLFLEAIDALERNMEISKRMFMLSSKEPAHDVLSATPVDQDIVGIFVTDFYNSNSEGVVLKRSLQDVIRSIRSTNGVLIPQIKLSKDGEEKLEFGGAALIKDNKLSGWIDSKHLQGYFWLVGSGVGGQVTAKYNDTNVPLHVDKNKTQLFVEQRNGKIICKYNIKIEGNIEEYHFSSFTEKDLTELEKLYAEAVEKDIQATWTEFYENHKADGFSIKEDIRKKYHYIYKDTKPTFDNIKFIPDVSVSIHNTGAII